MLKKHALTCINRDDWLEDLPPEWPINTEMHESRGGEEVEIPSDKLEE